MRGALIRSGRPPVPPPPADPYFANVMLLVNFNGNRTDFSVDQRVLNSQHNGTPPGDSLSSTVFKFGGGSSETPGVNAAMYVVTPSGTSGTTQLAGPFTMEGWVRPRTNKRQGLFGQNDGTSIGATAAVLMLENDGRLLFRVLNNYSSNGYNLFSTDLVPLNAWTHVAVTRDINNVVRLFVGGVLQPNTQTEPTAYIGDLERLVIAGRRNSSTIADVFDGFLDDIRITRGVCRYTNTFTPPTEAFSDQGPDPLPPDPLVNNVAWYYPLTANLNNARGIVAPVTVPTPLLPYSGAVINSDFPLNGYNTLRLNGGAYLDLSWALQYSGAQRTAVRDQFAIEKKTRFTLEYYVYFAATAQYQCPVGTWANIGVNPFTTYGWAVVMNNLRAQGYFPGSVAAGQTAYITSLPANAMAVGAWHHVCWERDNTVMRVYIDGQKVGELLATATPVSDCPDTIDDAYNPTGFTVGGLPAQGTNRDTNKGYTPINGAIAGIRATVNVCRYGCPDGPIVPETFPYRTT